jgi:hypothetical protein
VTDEKQREAEVCSQVGEQIEDLSLQRHIER